MMVLLELLEVRRQVVDPGRQEGDLNFGRACVHPALSELRDDVGFLFFGDCHCAAPSCL